MKNLKRLLALIGVILLAGMYILTLIFALTDNSAAGNMLMASLFGTVIIPVLIYAILLVYKWTTAPTGPESPGWSRTGRFRSP